MTTKEQERKALEQIRKIVEGLGECSYLATAFEGCFEDAENNINDDAAYSMKSRLESEAARAERFKTATEDLHDKLERANKQIDDMVVQISKLSERILRDDDIEACIAMANERKTEYETQADEAAERIVELADRPDTEDFKEAVSKHRSAKRACKKNESLADRLAKAIAAE